MGLKESRDKISQIDAVLLSVGGNFRLTSFTPMPDGHMHVPLYSCFDIYEDRMVIKFGVDKKTNQEVKGNQEGYLQIARQGGNRLLPKKLTMGECEGSHFILMKHHGKNLIERGKSRETINYVEFIHITEDIYKETLHSGYIKFQIIGIKDLLGQIVNWHAKLFNAGVSSFLTRHIINKINPKLLASPKNTLMLLDFTIDNLFIEEGKVTFIDPWKQKTYLGTPIPGIAQFITAADDIFHLPGASSNRKNFENLISRLGQLLELDHSQIEKQFYLGASLQYALSSYVRIGTDQISSRIFAEKSRKLLEKALI